MQVLGPTQGVAKRLALWLGRRYAAAMSFWSSRKVWRRGAGALVLVGIAGCGRVDKPGSATSVSGASATTGVPVTSEQSGAKPRGTYGMVTAPPAPEPEVTFSAQPPPVFDDGSDVVLVNSDAAGCKGKSRDGWLQVRCAAEAPGRGRLVRAEVEAGWVGATPGRAPGADGTLTLELPWFPGQRGAARIEATDGVFRLETHDAGGGFRRVLPQAQADACDQLAAAFKQRMSELRQVETGPVRALDVRRFPKFGACEVAGADAWALDVAKVTAAGEGAEREVSLSLNVVHVDAKGKLAKAAWGPIAFAPGSVAFPDVMLFDYDDDKASEVVVRHDVLARGDKGARKALPKLPGVLTYRNGRVSPLAGLGLLPSGATVAEHIDGDKRPDPGDYGPYVAWLGLDCGIGKCPERVLGPRFYRRSLPDGSFDANAPEVTAALQRACSRNQGELVSDVETASGKTRTALNVACARVRGDSAEAVLSTLNQAKTQICGDAADCQLFSVLSTWAKTEPPRKLVLPRKE